MKNSFRNSVALLFVVLLTACGATNRNSSKVQDTKVLDELAETKALKFDVQWVRPLLTTSVSNTLSRGLTPPGSTANQINVMGSGYYIQIEGDSVSGNLPYYGERQMGGGYGENAGIRFEGRPRNLEIVKDEDKQRYDIDFTIADKAESFNISMTLLPSLSATTVVNSSNRTPIRYDGSIVDLDGEALQ